MPLSRLRHYALPAIISIPTIAAAFWSNWLWMQHDQISLMTRSIFAFTVGSALFGIVWVAVSEMCAFAFETYRARRGIHRVLIWWTIELLRVAIAGGWVMLVFDTALSETPTKLRSAALLAAYSIVTGWWVLQIFPQYREASAKPFISAFIVGTAALTITLVLVAEVQLLHCILIALVVISTAAYQSARNFWKTSRF
jgi:hypothetical protein